jgi:tRNA threonylcarbamoyl adenosine modification protein YjeE
MSMDVELRSLLHSENETRAFGRRLGGLLRPGDWVALSGDLGSGKTTLVAGVLEAIHPGMRGRSPTYVLVEVYGSSPVVIHADLYRLASPAEYAGLALEELAERDGIVLVEWAERAEGRLPAERLDLSLRFPPGRGRELRIRPRGDRWTSIALEGALDREHWSGALDPRH